ncbi:MAG: maltodextrin glucosidase [Candidatus Eremiobacterota bacterium]
MTEFDWKKTLYTDGSEYFLKYSENKLQIKLVVHKNEDIEEIYVRTSPDGEQKLTEMKKDVTKGFFDLYTGKIDIKCDFVNYRFLIFCKNDMFWFSHKGLSRAVPPDITDFKFIRNFKTPEWVTESVFYQIFPDRFCDGNPSTRVKNGEYTYCGKSSKACSWGENPKDYHHGGHMDFFGGDLAGIKEKIPYLKELGINALYLNPVFLSPSNHKYDTQDYKLIDPHTGTNEEFAELVSLLHENGIKIILDGVFNHTGISHYWFNKAGFYPDNTGAYRDRSSPYREYFTFYDKKDDYHAWLGVKTLPKLNYKSERLRQEIYKSPSSVMNFWMKSPYNIDGWRLDVANMLGRQDDYQGFRDIYREMRKSCKDTKEDSYIMGEHFFDPSELLQGDMLDGTMNYQGFLFPVLKWLTKKERVKKEFRQINFTSEDLSRNIENFTSLLPFDVKLSMFNLLDCHDLPRFYSLVGEDFHKFKIGLVLLFTWPGVPCIYYGDETGMKGIKEYEVRKCMEWNEKLWDHDIMTLYKKLIKLRKSSSVLKRGGFKILHDEDEIFSYARIFGDSVIFVVINNNNEKKSVKIPLWQVGKTEGVYKEFFSEEICKIEEGFFQRELEPYQCLVVSRES